MAHDEHAQVRDPVTGQFAYEGDWSRMCTCGHTLGVHVHGGFDCLNGESIDGATGEPCDCTRFRPSRRRRPEGCVGDAGASTP